MPRRQRKIGTPRVRRPRKPRKRYTRIPHYFIKSTNATRRVLGFGVCKKGEWVEVPLSIFQGFKRAVANAGVGETVGWIVKMEIEKLEV